jgi:PKD repeat protein
VKRLVFSSVVIFLLADLMFLPSVNVVAKNNTSLTESNGTAKAYYELTVIIDPTTGGWTQPGEGVHTYPAGTIVTVYWWHSPWWGLAYYDINGTIVDMSNYESWGYNITMNANYVLRAVYFKYHQLGVSINPLTATIYTNHPVTLLANISDGWWGVTITFYVNETKADAWFWLDNTPEWNFTASPQPRLPGGQIEWDFTPTSPGVYLVYAHAEDFWPYETKSLVAILTVHDPPHSPVARFAAAPWESRSYEPVFFNASASLPGFDGDDECPVSWFSWNFGDGNSGIGKTITHVYDEPGNYTVTLTVMALGEPPYIDAHYVSINSMSTIIQVEQGLPVERGGGLSGGCLHPRLM